MTQSDEVIDLDYHSPLENVLWFLATPWCIGLCSLGVWMLFTLRDKDGDSLWADFPTWPFMLVMSCIWALGYWLKPKYDVRYQLNPRTQQLELTRTIFGHAFRNPIAPFSQLYAVATLSSWVEQKGGGKVWSYAVGLVTRSGRIIRVSPYQSSPDTQKAAEIASKMGIHNSPCRREAGRLKVRRGPDGEPKLNYDFSHTVSGETIVFLVFIAIIVGSFLFSAFVK